MWRWGASLGALGLALALAQGASAQTANPTDPPPPINQSVDANGVDVISGALTLSVTQVSIGPSAGRLGRVFQNFQARDNNYGAINSSGSLYTVSLGTASETFVLSGSTFTSQQQTGSSLAIVNGLYIYTLRDGSVATYNPGYGTSVPVQANVALLTGVTTPTGEAVSYAYNNYYSMNPKTGVEKNYYWPGGVANGRGLALNYTYANTSTPNPTLTSVQAVNNAGAYGGQSVSWPTATYSGTSATDPLSRKTTYGTPAASTTQTITLPTGNPITVVYDSSARVSSYSNGVGTWSYAYSINGSTQTTTVTDPNGNKKTYVSNTASDTLTSFTDALNRVTSYTYDAYGRVTQVSYPHGNAVQYVYDGRGNVTQTTQVPASGSGQSNIVTSANFDASCTYPAKCNKPNSTTDGRGNVTSYTYDNTTGVLLTLTQPTGANGTAPQTRYSYTWEQANIANGSGGTTQGARIYLLTGVSSCGKGSAGGSSSCVGTANETRTTITYDPNHNLAPVSVTTAAGDGSIPSTQGYSYDAYGNVATSTSPLGAVTTYVYDADRELTGMIGPDPDGGGPRTPAAAQLTYDGDGHVTVARTGSVNSQTDTGFSSFTLGTYTSYNYDGAGRLSQTFGGQVTSGTLGPAYAETDYQYDNANRLQCTATRLNTASFGTVAACGLTAAGIDGPDRITYHGYYNDDSPYFIISGYGSSTSTYPITNYYNADGTLGTVVDGDSHASCLGYDGFGRKASVTFPSPNNGGSCNTADYNSFAYDANSNLTSQRKRDGSTLSFAYDALNHLTTGGDGATYAYDNYGDVTSAAYNNVTTTFTYDAFGRKLAQVSAIGTVASAYDAAGDRTKLTWPDGFYVNYGYDLTGALTAVEEQGATSGVGLLASYTLDNFGRRTGAAYAGSSNILNQGFLYDSASRPSITAYGFADSSKNLQAWNTYNAASGLKIRLFTNNQYDWNGAAGATTGYGINGLDQIATAAASTFSYTANGSLSNDGTRGYGYDALQRLTSATGFSAGYDALGRIYNSSNGSASTYYLYDGSDLIGEYSSASSSATLRRYVPGIAGADDPIVWYEGSSTSDRRWLLKDQQGSVIAVANPAGQALGINSYDAAGAPGQANLGRYQYTGQAWIPEVGVYNYKARLYSPTIGRFLQTDPIGYGDGPNWYGYVHGDPVNGSDPTGTDDDPNPCYSNRCGIDPDTSDYGSDTPTVTCTCSCPVYGAYYCTPAFSGTGGGSSLSPIAGPAGRDPGGSNGKPQGKPASRNPVCSAISKLPKGYGVYGGAQITVVPGAGFSDAVRTTYVSNGQGGVTMTTTEQAFVGNGASLFGGGTAGLIIPGLNFASASVPFGLGSFLPKGGLKAAFGVGGDIGANNIGLSLGVGYSAGLLGQGNPNNSASRILSSGGC